VEVKSHVGSVSKEPTCNILQIRHIRIGVSADLYPAFTSTGIRIPGTKPMRIRIPVSLSSQFLHEKYTLCTVGTVIGHGTLPSHWGYFEFLRKFANLSPLSTTTAISLSPVLPAIDLSSVPATKIPAIINHQKQQHRR
jgi:hypothetical protein